MTSYGIRVMPIVALGILLALLALPVDAQAKDPIGQVVKQSGLVTAVNEGRARALSLGDPIYEGDRVRAEYQVAIHLQDGSVLVLGAATEADVSQLALQPDRRQGVLSLIDGILRLLLAPGAPADVKISTEQAVAAARSTDWVVMRNVDGTAVFVVAGQVAVDGRVGGSVLLNAGDGTDVRPGAAPTPVAAWGAPRVQAALARVPLP